MAKTPPGLIIAAPSSGSGKTLITLGLLRHFARSGVAIGSAKVGPDYIDPSFHTAATGRPCFNLDLWAMRRETILHNLSAVSDGAGLVIAEGVMGLFDGAADGRGSTADLAALTGWPVVLVVDARSQGASAAALVRGFATHRADLKLAGVIFNKVGTNKHRQIIADAMASALPEITVLGFIPRIADMEIPSRHLGLVQAREKTGLNGFIDTAAALIAQHIDCSALQALAKPAALDTAASTPFPPPGQRIAVADDIAFAFAYPHILEGWRRAGAEILPFSPLAGDAPSPDADAVYLPGGYPELHAGTLSGNARFLSGLQDAASAAKPVIGECGGYMVLGNGLIDADGDRYAMAGLLPVETSFADRKLHLGYRRAITLCDSPFGPAGEQIAAHEFHYATTVSEGPGEKLFDTRDAAGSATGPTGLRAGSVAGSFLHLIDSAA
ncbi:MAG: cobyrinate a,c-diamide synthase [Alphaproteobacteria bacterium]